jgi:hypothetical protein
MQRMLVVVAVVLSLAVVPTAVSGGWATVQLSSTPSGLEARQVWDVRLTVLQHGVTPVRGVRPAVLIRKGAVQRSFPARPTGVAGVYRARVVFPSAGRWTWRIDDGFTRVHSYAPVRIATAR